MHLSCDGNTLKHGSHIFRKAYLNRWAFLLKIILFYKICYIFVSLKCQQDEPHYSLKLIIMRK